MVTGPNPRTAVSVGWLRLFGCVIKPEAYLCKLLKFRAQRIQKALIQVINDKTAAAQGAHRRARGTQSFIVIDQQAVICFLAILFLCTVKCFLKVQKSRKMNFIGNSAEEYNTSHRTQGLITIVKFRYSVDRKTYSLYQKYSYRNHLVFGD